MEQTPKKLPLRIFISYRRNDSAGHTGRIYDRLRSEFGQDALFMDVDAIPLGANFVHVLREEVAKCDVFLAIIGPGWLDSRDDDGHRRLDNPTDFVRVEISTALQRNIPVIPILLDGTRMPKQQGLPPDLQSLPERNGLDVRHASFHADMDKLVRGVKDSKVSGPASASIATAKAFDADVAIAAKGRWVSEFHVDVESSQPPTVFKHYFMRVVLNGSFMEGFTTNAGAAPGAFIGPGTILVGDRWDGTTSPLWIVKHGHARLPTSKVCASFGQLTYLGPTWRPEFAALSDAVFKKLGGKPLERFITHP